MSESKRGALESALRDNLSQTAADNLALEVLPEQSLRALGDLLGVDEKMEHLDRVKTLLEEFAADLTKAMQQGGQREAINFWNQTWPVVDANLCKIIEPVEDETLRTELEAYYVIFQEKMGAELLGHPEEEEKA